MILKIFNQPLQKSADYIVSYLLDEEKHQGYKPELIQGSPDLTRTITNAITRKQKYIAGCIRLRNDENLSEAKQLELINRFERTFAPFDDPARINFLWVRHKDKGGIELNFVCPRTDLKTGKAYNIHPPGKQTKLLVNCFIALENHRHGFKQIDGSTLNDSAKKIEIVKNIAKQRALYIAQKIDKSIKSPKLKFNQEDKNGKQKQQLHSRRIRLNDGLANNLGKSESLRNQLQSIKSTSDFIRANFHGQAGNRDLSKASHSANDYKLRANQVTSSNPDGKREATQAGRTGNSQQRQHGKNEAQTLTTGSIENQIYALSLQLNESSPAQRSVLLAKIYHLRVQKDFQDAQAMKQQNEQAPKFKP
jgi:hypothetical protein